MYILSLSFSLIVTPFLEAPMELIWNFRVAPVYNSTVFSVFFVGYACKGVREINSKKYYYGVR